MIKSYNVQNATSKKMCALFSAFILSLFLISPSWAMFEQANTLIQNAGEGLISLAVATITIAIVVIGYKVLWDGKSIADCKNIIIGAALIGGASGIAGAVMVS